MREPLEHLACRPRAPRFRRSPAPADAQEARRLDVLSSGCTARAPTSSGTRVAKARRMIHRSVLATLAALSAALLACSSGEPAASSTSEGLASTNSTDEDVCLPEDETVSTATFTPEPSPAPDSVGERCDWGDKEKLTSNTCHLTSNYYRDANGKMCRGKDICSGQKDYATCKNGRITKTRISKACGTPPNCG
jgi:hypothetical protein